MQELEARGYPVKYNKNASGPKARSLEDILKKSGHMGGGDLKKSGHMGGGDRYAIHALLQNDEVLILTSNSPCYYRGNAMLEKLGIYN